MSCINESCNKRGCGCECCTDYEYSCRAVNTREGRIFYFNDNCRAKKTYKAIHGRAFESNDTEIEQE